MDAKKLKEIRKLTGLSQGAFGKKIDASRAQIRDWEQDLYKIPTWAEKNINREFVIGEKAAAYGRLSRQQLKMQEIFEEILESGDDEILNHLDRHMSLLIDLLNRRKSDKPR